MPTALALMLLHTPLVADVGAVEEMIRIDAGLRFAHFQQQVKSDVGGARGDRIVDETHFGLSLFGSYNVWGPFRAGLYAQLDLGSREAGRFGDFDMDGATIVEDRVGGSYLEFWIGPMIRVQWRGLFAELGWGAIGIRSDDARDDLPASDGSTGAFRTTPAIAWLVALGGVVPVVDAWSAVFRLEYRIRYYDSRGGDDLRDNVVHGTQDITPFVGITWQLDRELPPEPAAEAAAR
jgi:hypothetical protein